MTTPEKAPAWAEWLDDRHLAVECKKCRCVYTKPYESFGGKMVGGIPRTCKVCKRRRDEEARKALPIDPALVKAVQDHAQRLYRKGWDYVVELYTDEQIWEVIAGSKSDAAAIRAMGRVARLLYERETEVRWE